MTKTYSYESLVETVWNIGVLEFRNCFVLRASDFEFNPWSVFCTLTSDLRPLTSEPRLARRVYPESVEGPDLSSRITPCPLCPLWLTRFTVASSCHVRVERNLLDTPSRRC